MRTGGIEGNERLTGLTAIVLLLLLATEGVTILFLRPLLSVHLFVGLLLIPPIALKLASTGYRFVRYYTHDAGYRAKGPPAAWLRATAPVVVVSTVAVLASGVWLLLAGPRSRDTVLPIHKVSFIVWIAFTGVHVLGHLPALPRAVIDEYGGGGARRWERRPGAGSRDGRAVRQLALLGAMLVGIVLALAFLPDFGAWQHFHHHHVAG